MEQLRNPSEQKLLEALRSLEDGKVIVKVHNGIPATMEVWTQTRPARRKAASCKRLSNRERKFAKKYEKKAAATEGKKAADQTCLRNLNPVCDPYGNGFADRHGSIPLEPTASASLPLTRRSLRTPYWEHGVRGTLKSCRPGLCLVCINVLPTIE